MKTNDHIMKAKIKMKDFIEWYQNEPLQKFKVLHQIKTFDAEFSLLENVEIDGDIIEGPTDAEPLKIMHDLFEWGWEEPIEITVWDDGRDCEILIHFDDHEIVIEATVNDIPKDVLTDIEE